MPKRKVSNNTIAGMAVLTALSIVLCLLVRFRIFPSAPYLEYDAADIPIMVAAFMYGPLSGFIVCVLVSIIQGITVSADSGIFGVIMHIVLSGSYAVLAGALYRRNRTMRGAVSALILGTMLWIILCIPMNYLITPLYTNVKAKDLTPAIFSVILPFNIIKVGINSIVTFLVYKRLRKLFSYVASKSPRLTPFEVPRDVASDEDYEFSYGAKTDEKKLEDDSTTE